MWLVQHPQDWQSMHNITCSHVHVTIVAEEAVRITYTECALVAQYTKCMQHIIVICGPSGSSTIFFYIIL
jgi:hypothetical protein